MLLNDVLKSYGAIEKTIKTSLFNEVRKEVEKNISTLFTENDFLSMVDEVKKNHNTTHFTLFSTENNSYMFVLYEENNTLYYDFLSCDRFSIEHENIKNYKDYKKCTKLIFKCSDEVDDRIKDNYLDIVHNQVLYFLDDLIFTTPISEL